MAHASTSTATWCASSAGLKRQLSAEPELYAINTGAAEALHLANLMEELALAGYTTTTIAGAEGNETKTVRKRPTITSRADSTSSKALATRGQGKRSKRITIRRFWVQETVRAGALRLAKVGTHDNMADTMTKYVATSVLLHHLGSLGLTASTMAMCAAATCTTPWHASGLRYRN